ncbi:uncharacterized protein LOC123450767 [Hordeum vulgare subsp. vulgare]|uniref:Cystatin domain-containing protein n=1 Tax=Hordeum vulgare subsp. vulgare TaxID=112509 RepID=A0A8I6Y3Q5_HORVV|nr:uncharacterized protein LOC123450767 [Hordeum vulgare subsp. vulgare]
MRSLPLLLLGAVLLVAATLPEGTSAKWTAANPHGVVIQQVGRFAVIVYDLAHRAGMTYVGVARGETEEAVGGGTIYRLVVAAAKPDGSRAQYECLVWGVPGSSLTTWKLCRFRKIAMA